MSQQFFSTFAAYIDQSGQIVAQFLQGSQVVGVTAARYAEAERLAKEAAGKAEDYHKQLVDAGLIKPKLSTDEQIAALTQQVALLTELITAPDPMKKESAS
jgi:hypothetical protein